MAKTVKGIKSYFTKEEIKNEDRERRTQKFIGWPSNTTFKPIIKNQLICNSDINIYDINREYIISGTATPLLQWKMDRQITSHVKITRIPLTLTITDHHKYIHLYIDLLYVSGVPLLHTRQGKINLCYVQACLSR